MTKICLKCIVIKTTIMSLYLKTFGEVVAHLRVLKNISQEQMASELMISLQELKNLETTKELQTKETVEKIVEYFQIPPHFIPFLMVQSGDLPEDEKEGYRLFKNLITSLLFDKRTIPSDVSLEKKTFSSN